MLHTLRRRLEKDERGFTLVELLVVVLIIGILAAIALPTFLGQSDKAADADSKSKARNMASHMESCRATERRYTGCNTDARLTADRVSADERANVTFGAVTADSYAITATSPDTSNAFTLSKTAGQTTRTCTPRGQGACPSTGNW